LILLMRRFLTDREQSPYSVWLNCSLPLLYRSNFGRIYPLGII
jgi:hypothetical protein